MISKDADLISEAYLSAMQKNHNFAPDPAMGSVAEANPELTDRENVESPVAMTVSVPAGPEAMGAMDQGSGCGCAGSDQAHEESEEHWTMFPGIHPPLFVWMFLLQLHPQTRL